MDSQSQGVSVDELVSAIPDGASVAIFKDSGVPAEAARALIRRGVRDLHVITVPTGGFVIDLLIGAGCVGSVETSGISLGEFGQAPCFVRAAKSRTVRILDATCPAVYAGLQAGEKGIPFMPLRGLIGTGVLAGREDFKVIDNPFADGDPIVLLPAITPDFSIVHSPNADRFGNVNVGMTREVFMMAHASAKTLVTVERMADDNLFADPQLADSTINALYISGVAEAPGGARPMNMPDCYEIDRAHIETYARMAQTEAGMAEYLDTFVHARPEAAE